MDKKYLDYFMEHFYKEDLPPRELVGAAALFERMYTSTAQLLIGENNENSCSFCGAKWTIKSNGSLVCQPSNRKISIYCPMCGRHFVTKDLDDIMKEEKLQKLKGQLSTDLLPNIGYSKKAITEVLQELPPVTPQEPRCKECKWWKDSDGEYRRGCGAESKCPINRREVFNGNGYCYLFEPQEREDKEWKETI